MAEVEIGVVTHFFSKISVAAIKLTGDLKVGDKIKIKGSKTGFEQDIESMQINREAVQEAKPDDEIGIKTKEKVRANDKVYRIE